MSPASSHSVKIEVPEGVNVRQFDGEWIVLDLVRGNYFGLNEVAGDIFERLAGGHSAQDVAASLAVVYDSSEASIMNDVVRLIADLERLGLVRVVSGA
jgi:hypothetical protein